MKKLPIKRWHQVVENGSFHERIGKVSKVIGLTIEVEGLKTFIGEVCDIIVKETTAIVKAEVVGFNEEKALLMVLGGLSGISKDSLVVPTRKPFTVEVGEHLLGQILNGLGQPMNVLEDRGIQFDIDRDPPNPLNRRRISEVISTGIKAIDGLLTVGEGQRMGIFAGSGVGKSTLLGMISRYGEAEVNVICLIGERGREVLEFIERDLGPEGMKKSVIVCATSDQPALVRIKSAYVATSIAEYFRDQGKKVMLMMDSVTRFAMAQREVGLAIGEPPTSKGYTPSVFALLPRLLERSGMGEVGSITAFYTVLVDGDDLNEPIADTVRGILDGHIVLSRKVAARNHYPAIDINVSVSRLMKEIATPEHNQLAGMLRNHLATYEKNEDLINIGAYVRGSNPKVDEAMLVIDGINQFLQQGLNEHFTMEQVDEQLRLALRVG
ncbi:flagellar protein export ATPase FliI [Turicibacter sanguinis]|uniref:flagellar protein export ATPase FliI n=1 Tax=Turicibacter sanguinis TaxID=154288 RepID=UPI0018AB081F|nr:flagellar protein export ATPase FliI [Turicibacter sanguinis]MDB8551144.1 flagellar protein export ATPase FliI [Turicibacter sanguinis]